MVFLISFFVFFISFFVFFFLWVFKVMCIIGLVLFGWKRIYQLLFFILILFMFISFLQLNVFSVLCVIIFMVFVFFLFGQGILVWSVMQCGIFLVSLFIGLSLLIIFRIRVLVKILLGVRFYCGIIYVLFGLLLKMLLCFVSLLVMVILLMCVFMIFLLRGLRQLFKVKFVLMVVIIFFFLNFFSMQFVMSESMILYLMKLF